jgi:hypothetical protein
VSDVEYDMGMLGCRPMRLKDLSPHRRAIWDKVRKDVGYDLEIYEGSVIAACDSCGIDVAVGPRQQAKREEWVATETPYMVVCFICAAQVAAEHAESGEEVNIVVQNLGNPGRKN